MSSIVAVSLYTLVTAAERAVSSLLTVACHFDVPDVLVGMTVLALGTSLPEIGSNVVASVGIAAGSLEYEVTSAVVVGGNVGSATVQQFLLVGVLVPGYGRIDVTDSFLRGSYVPMVAALALTLTFAWDGALTRVDGGLLLLAYLAYAVYSYRTRERQMALPELSAVLDAVRRQTPTVALGVLVGSNLVNPIVGLGLGAAISGYHVPPPVVFWDFPVKLLVALVVLAYLRLGPDRALTRREGSYLVVAYLVYLSGRLLVFTTA